LSLLSVSKIDVEKAGDLMRKKTLFVSVAISLLTGCGNKELRVQEFQVAVGIPDAGRPPESFML
jgi:hypothetical protein